MNSDHDTDQLKPKSYLGLKWSVSVWVLALIFISMILSALAFSTSRSVRDEALGLKRLHRFLEDQARSRYPTARRSIEPTPHAHLNRLRDQLIERVTLELGTSFIITESALYRSPRRADHSPLTSPPHPQHFITPKPLTSPLILPIIRGGYTGVFAPKHYELGLPISLTRPTTKQYTNHHRPHVQLIIRIRTLSLKDQLTRLLSVSGVLLLTQMFILLCFALYLAQKALINPLLKITQLARALPAEQRSPDPQVDRAPPEVLTLQSALINLHRALRDEQQLLASAYLKLQERERLITAGYLSARVMHELGNPLASVSGLVDFLREDPMTPDAQKELLELALGELRRMKDTSRMLLNLSQPDHESPDHLMRTSASELIEWLKFILRYHERYAMIDLWVTGDLNLNLQIASDPLKHALLNLILNAAHAQGGEGKLWIDLQLTRSPHAPLQKSQAPLGVRILLCDQGPGVTHEHLPELLASTTQSLIQRRGLGLSIARESVDQHGGHLWIYCARAADRPELKHVQDFPGARFALWAPLADASAYSGSGLP